MQKLQDALRVAWASESLGPQSEDFSEILRKDSKQNPFADLLGQEEAFLEVRFRLFLRHLQQN